jgi:hypothetical protein
MWYKYSSADTEEAKDFFETTSDKSTKALGREVDDYGSTIPQIR